ncbi:MAG TPA: hypothetical protein VNB22_01750 [Pyrinomonadaceae bacterium]|nr:hypothetical protein [Pyrinomonadaceae bacterium]
MSKNKTLLKWKEPQIALKAFRNQITWKDIALSFAVYAGKFVAGGFLIVLIIYIITVFRNGFYFDEKTAAVFFLLMLCGLLLGFVLWMRDYRNRTNPHVIYFGNEYIQISNFLSDYAYISYGEIQNYNIKKAEVENAEFRILEIKSWNDVKLNIWIEQNIKSEDIVEIFNSKKVQLRSSQSAQSAE